MDEIEITIDAFSCQEPISAFPNGGISPYTYEWDGPDGPIGYNANSINITSNGNYYLTVYDANGCFSIDSTMIIDCCPNGLEVQLNNNSCQEPIFAITTGGSDPYIYSWWTPNGSTENISDSLAISDLGTYSVTVTDASGCINENSITIENCCNDIIEITMEAFSCYEPISAFANGGNTPYTFEWKGPDGPISYNSNSIFPSGNGNYYLTITDADGCMAIDSTSIFDCCPNGLEIQLSNNSCQEPIYATTTGGTDPYTYSWMDLNGPITNSTDSLEISEAGTYTVVVVDASGCMNSQYLEILSCNPCPSEIIVSDTSYYKPNYSYVSNDSIMTKGDCQLMENGLIWKANGSIELGIGFDSCDKEFELKIGACEF